MSAFTKLPVFFGTLGYFCTPTRTPKFGNSDNQAETRRAICILESQPNEVAKGVVYFEQTSTFAPTKITGDFTGLTPGNKHGFHIH